MNLEINGIRINYISIGEGKPFLVLHGWRSKSDRWQRVAEILSNNGFKVIIPDLPGFGRSEELKTAWNLDNYADFCFNFIQSLGIDNFYLAGHSFSGATAIKMAIKDSSKIEKLFLIAPACIREKTFKKSLLFFISKIFKVFSFIPFLRKAFYKFIVRKSDYQYNEGIMKQTYLKIISEDLSGVLGLIKLPCILIWGDKDVSVPLNQGEIIHEKIKGSKLEIIPGVGHAIEQEAPDILGRKILENI